MSQLLPPKQAVSISEEKMRSDEMRFMGFDDSRLVARVCPYCAHSNIKFE